MKTFPEFKGKTADDIAERVGIWLRDARKKGADVATLCLIMMKEADGSFKAQIGSREMLIVQVSRMDPVAGVNIARELMAHRDRLAIFSLDLQTKEHGLTWMDPLPNAKGGAS